MHAYTDDGLIIKRAVSANGQAEVGSDSHRFCMQEELIAETAEWWALPAAR